MLQKQGLFVTVLLSLLIGPPVRAIASEQESELVEVAAVEGGGSIFGSLQDDRPLAYSVMNEPAWVPRVLDILKKGRSRHLKQVAHIVFRQDGRPTFLAIVWRDNGLRREIFHLHKVTVRSAHDVRLRFVREIMSTYVEMKEPSGHDVFGDGVPTVFVSEGSGGSMRLGYTMHVLRLTRASVDARPGGLPEIAYLVPGNATTHVLRSVEARWGGFFGTCGFCGPYVPRFLRAEKGRYVAACQAYSSHYRGWAAAYEADPDEDPFWRLAHVVTASLYLVQGGFLEEGRARFAAAVTEAERVLAEDTLTDKPEKLRELVAITRASIGEAIAQASANAGCPLDASKSRGARPGYEDRISRFR